jgi:deferrochelatase/peroxidase EfeB
MTHCFLTIAIPIDDARVAAANAALDAMGNPAIGDIRKKLREDLQIHFLSIGAISGDGAAKGHLVFEASSDASAKDTIALIVTKLDLWLQPVFAAAGLPASNLVGLLGRHVVETGQGWFDHPGLNHTGTPGMTARRIRDEYDLARKVRTLWDDKTYPGSAVEVLAGVRADIAQDPKLAPLLKLEPAPFLVETKDDSSILSIAPGLLIKAVTKYFLPVLLVGILLTALAVWGAWRSTGLATALLTLLAGLGLTLLAVFILLGLIYASLRKHEASDLPDNSIPNATVLTEVVQRENKGMQNHMTGVSRIKPGRLRAFTLRLAFWIIGSLASRFRPGYLADIGTIHFARWVVLPGTDQLIFFSNFGGSWESYLEDFITKAHTGLTGVWSNTEGFPKSANLFLEGATDGDPFKRWARRQHRPTYFWYSAYPHLTTDRIRSNASIRQGLAGASTEDEAKAWLANLGSRMPPVGTLDTPEIQTIVFGGLKHHPYAASLLLTLPDAATAARAWLADPGVKVAFGDQPDPEKVTQLALSASGLRRLGLDEEQLASFPFAFNMGMANPVRSNILYDTGSDKPARWIWGGEAAVDAALVLYGASEDDLAAMLESVAARIGEAGGAVVHQVGFRPLDDAAQASGGGRRNQEKEAFGFADGVSQPIIKGTRRWMKDTDAIHAVEPGEFLLGYPDNRGGQAISPLVRSGEDPHNLLPVADPAYAAAHYPSVDASGANRDRDLGRNGSYLVIRQLAQNVPAFDKSVEQAAEHCKDHPGMPPALVHKWQREQWVAAKMVGRWRDGTSLVRYPHRPGTGWSEKPEEDPGANGPIPVEPDNGFLLGAEDPVGERCPFGAHIRRSNPRESLTPGSMEQLDITNRHRILRIGRRYVAYEHDGKPEKEGLFFMCLNGDIERQFEFIQQTWAMAMQFMGVENEVDAILVRGAREEDEKERKLARLTIPTPHGPIYVRNLRDVTEVRGGGYFFLPSRSAIAWLSS